jgi:hypothetical protein
MTHSDNHSEDSLGSQANFQEMLTERLRDAVRVVSIA